ncbi:calcium-translocating P-type ATPase, PMCA-type [Cryptococcus sp. DSM 104549]
MPNNPPPQLIITTDSAPTPSPPSPGTPSPTSPPHLSLPATDASHSHSTTDPSHLSPNVRHQNIHGSPVPSYSSGRTPPSPTLTNSSSVHFSDELHSPSSPTPQTSLALRDNHPTAESGADTLQVIGEDGRGRHQRGFSVASNNTWASDIPTEEGLSYKKGGGKDVLSRATTAVSGKPAVSAEGEAEAEAEEEGNGKKKKKGKKSKEEIVSHLDPDKDTTDPTPFRENPSRLAMLVDPKSLEDLEKIGGIDGLLAGLGVDGRKGLSVGTDEGSVETGAPRTSADMPGGHGPEWRAGMDQRRKVYGRNDLPERKSKSLLLLMWLALKDKVLILLSIAAVVSLALGLYQDLGTPPTIIHNDDCPDGCEEPRVDWVEGVAIVVAIVIVVMVGSVNDWQKERQFKKLNEKREDRTVKCIRGGNEMVINVRDVVVGDICLLEPGEIVPVDGVFLRGHNVRCDESGATGESDAIRKFSYDECIAERDSLGPDQKRKKDCFLISGAKVLEGVGEYVVIAVGPKSFNGRIMMALRGDAEETPLQLKLNALAELIAKLGALSGILLFAALMIRFFVQLKTDPGRSANDKAQSFVQILIIAVTLVVVAVPEGLPLAVTLALAFATKRMTKQNLLVRVLGACETMANATVVCTDKTGTLTQNEMSVVAGSLGVHGKFVKNLSDNASRSNANDVEGERDDFAFDMGQFNTIASPALQTLLNEAICINSTAFEDKDEDGNLQFVGSKTETALLRFAKECQWADYRQTRENAQIVQMIPFSSELKAMGVVIKRGNGGEKGGYRLYLKGASEVLTNNCTAHVVVHQDQPDAELEAVSFDERSMDNILKTIIFYANQSLRTIALCYRDFEEWPPRGTQKNQADEVPYQDIAKDMTLIAVTGIEDPLRPGVREAVEKCQHAGVAVKMCTGDNVLTARSIANQCGIFTPGGVIMEGPVFRKLTEAERNEIVPRLQILARSSPEDKRLLVKTLKDQGEVVGVTGDGTNDGPALKLANVGFAMGIAGTEVAKEASDIILMDDSFKNIVLAIMWGRCVNDSVKKFLQFQISVNITAVVITFVSAVASSSESSVLTAVQLLWVNLIMDTFAALALATDPASEASLDRKPDRKNAPLITVEMFKMVLVQATYQVIVCLVLHFAGLKILGLEDTDQNNSELGALVFNSFVFCQIFNQLNCRRLDRKFNVLEGFFRNYYFIVIFLIMVGGQILIIEVGGAAFQVVRLGGRDWGISLVIGAISLPIGALVRILPTEPLYKILIALHIYADPNKLPVVSPKAEEEEYQYNPALSKVKDNLSTYANIRGGRLRASSMVAKSRSSQLRDAGVEFPSLLTMIPTVIAGTVGAGAHWVSHNNSLGLSNPAGQDPSRSTAELFQGKVQLHPQTDPNDPLYAKFGLSPPSAAERERFGSTRSARSNVPNTGASGSGSGGADPQEVLKGPREEV